MSTVWRVIRKFSHFRQMSGHVTDTERWLEDLLHSLTPAALSGASWSGQYKNTELREFSLQELTTSLLHKRETTPGIDSITYSMLANLPTTRQQQLLRIFNAVLRQDEKVPDDWKKHIVIPIKKPGGAPEDFTAYRPVVLQSCVSKVLENMLKTRLEHQLEKNGFFDWRQNGFRKGKGTMENLTILTADIYKAMHSKNVTMCVFLDLKAAYDRVNLTQLRDCMNDAGIDKWSAELILELWERRWIHIRSPNTGSYLGPREALTGVPQGSPLSPFLFNVYSRRFREVLDDDLEFLLYADDLVLYKSGNSPGDLMHSIQRNLDLLAECLSAHGMTISVKKTKAITFGRGRRRNPETHLTINGLPIDWVNEYKYLGVILDRQLTWRSQINSICARASKGINAMKAVTRTWWGADSKVLLNLYYGLVRTHLDYGSTCILYAAKSSWRRLEQVQLEALRIVTGCMRSTPTNVVFSETGEMPFHMRRILTSVRFALKHSGTRIDSIFHKLLGLYVQHNEGGGIRIRYRDQVPAMVEAMDAVLTFSNVLRKSDRLPCFTFDFYTQMVGLDWEDSEIQKDDLNADFKLRELLESRFSGYEPVYTDASFEGENAASGIGVFYPRRNWKMKGRCIDNTSICSAEVVAIYLASHSIPEDCGNVVIISDSKSALQRVTRPGIQAKNDFLSLKTRDTIIQKTLEQRDVKLLWVPSHSGIRGNEEADRLAAMGRQSDDLFSKKLLPRDILARLTEDVWKRWMRLFETESQFKGTYYRKLVGGPMKKPWFVQGNSINRARSSLLCRMRSGHCLTPKHLMKIGIRDNDLCGCGATGDLMHIIFQCPEREVQGDELYRELVKEIGGPLIVEDILRCPLDKPAKLLTQYILNNNLHL